MTYVIFNSEQEGNAFVEEMNALYECPYYAENGYIMERWDYLKKSVTEEKWYCRKPTQIQQITYEEIAAIPLEWIIGEE